MNRRTFLGASAVVAAGCGTGPDRPTPGTTPFSNDRLASDLVERQQHLERLAHFRVPADAVRTTPPPPIAAVDEFPELKPLMKVAARLHPRYGAEPGVTTTKVGGTLAGPPPSSDAGPVVPVLQTPHRGRPAASSVRPTHGLVATLLACRNRRESAADADTRIHRPGQPNRPSREAALTRHGAGRARPDPVSDVSRASH